MNWPERVGVDKRERVLKAVRELGYVRDNAARQLRGASNAAIGIVAFDSHTPFFSSEVARGIEDAANEQDHLVIVCNAAGRRDLVESISVFSRRSASPGFC